MTQRITEPPYDGIRCPMCPLAVRNLAAVVHNLAWRLQSYKQHGPAAASPCKIADKFQDMKRAAESLLLADDFPPELKALHTAALNASKSTTIPELITHADALKAASDAVQPFSDAHFANRKHSHGDA